MLLNISNKLKRLMIKKVYRILTQTKIIKFIIFDYLFSGEINQENIFVNSSSFFVNVLILLSTSGDIFSKFS